MYTIKRNGDGYWVVLLGRHIMAKRTTGKEGKRQCEEWVALQEGKIDSILTGWQSTQTRNIINASRL